MAIMEAGTVASVSSTTGRRRLQSDGIRHLAAVGTSNSANTEYRPYDKQTSPDWVEIPSLTNVPTGPSGHRTRRRTSAAVRRRRIVLAVSCLLLIGLALPFGGSGRQTSKPIGSETLGHGNTSEYTVRPGDSLWTIAVRIDPSADPRPIVEELASQTGSYNVTPGERIEIP